MVFEAQAILNSGSGLTFVTECFVKKAKSYFPVKIKQTDIPLTKFQAELNVLGV